MFDVVDAELGGLPEAHGAQVPGHLRANLVRAFHERVELIRAQARVGLEGRRAAARLLIDQAANAAQAPSIPR